VSDNILRNTAANRQVTFEADGEPINADGSVEVTVTKADGSALAGSPFASTALGNGVYQYQLAGQASLNRLTEVWSGLFGGLAQSIQTEVEIVGGYYVPLGGVLAMPDMVGTSIASIVDAREWFESKVERYVGVAFVPRFARVALRGNGRPSLGLPHFPIRAVNSVGYYSGATLTPFTVGELADIVLPSETGFLARRTLGMWPTADMILEIEHGLAAPPAELIDAALVAISDKLRRDQTPASRAGRVYAVQTEVGVERRTRTGPGHPFGIDDVDEVVVGLRDTYRVAAVA
jgi:hypothetical protein